ncbi:MAG: YfhO family protein, partial [Candidatus Omnitrophica bacterium]|nr:YfhO family protein [Candidatus Omnitrophota bacterium]
LWTQKIGCGFPLFAESQVGGAHPVKWVLYGCLPFGWAYPASFVLLFGVGGYGAYRFARRIGLSSMAACIPALVFLFGSPYAGLSQGGAALWTLAWLPLTLDQTERFLDAPGTRAVARVSFLFAFAWLGGQPQMAASSVFFVLGYGVLRSRALEVRRPGSARILAGLSAAALLGLALSMVQLLPTAELVLRSVRSGADLSFALQKSMNPLNVATLLWPGFDVFLGGVWYVGLLPLALAVFEVLCRSELRRKAGIFMLLTALFVFLALGRHNPLYVLFLKWTGVHFFRVPVKFLFFAATGLGFAAGCGLDVLVCGGAEVRRQWVRLWIVFTALGGILFAGASLAARFLGPQLSLWGERYVRDHIYGATGHAGTLQSYLSRIPGILNAIIERTSWRDARVVMIVTIWIAASLLIAAAMRRAWRPRLWAVGRIAISVLDLFWFSFFGTGFRGNRALPSVLGGNPMVSATRAEREPYRVYEAAAEGSGSAPKVMPNTNMIYDYDSIGFYSPLALGRYHDSVRPFGVVDDSTGFPARGLGDIREHRRLLNLMNVRYLVSGAELATVGNLEALGANGNEDHVFRNPEAYPRAFVVREYEINGKSARLSAKRPQIAPGSRVLWEESGALQRRLRVTAPAGGLLFLSETDYPGWRLSVDGAYRDGLVAEGVFRGCELSAGEHVVEWRYVCPTVRIGGVISLLALFLSLALFVRGTKQRGASAA